MAGPAAGPNGGAIYIDGFSGGQLPSKDSIREIRVNQNPFSPEFDKLGFGRIEIFTKPGTDKFHGTAFYNFGDDVWNSRNPYAAQKAPFLLKEYGGNVSGPLNKRASFFLDIRRDAIDNGATINGSTLDPATLQVIDPYTQVFLTPQRRISASPRLDYQLSTNHTLTVRYNFYRTDLIDTGVGGFTLPSRGYETLSTSNVLQATETATLGTAVNEMRFQYYHARTQDFSKTNAAAINVLGSFNGGGSQVGHFVDGFNYYEFQNYTSLLRKTHSLKFGARLRGQTDSSVTPLNFGGTFTFSGGLGPELDANNQPVLDASGQPVLQQLSSIESYRRTLFFQQLGYTPAQIRALGGGASQFTISGGNPALSAGQFDVGVFFGDDWRVRPNLTVSLGLRYETQTNIHDYSDLAPRVGIAWAPGANSGKAKPKTVIRAGFGSFYDRFAFANVLTAFRYNGLLQQQYVVSNPDFFPNIPSLASLGGTASSQSTQEISSHLHAPYILQSAVSVERQLPKNTTVAVTYANSHGLHLLRSRDINAPLPGTYNPAVPEVACIPWGRPRPCF